MISVWIYISLVTVSKMVAVEPGRLDYQYFHVWLDNIENTT